MDEDMKCGNIILGGDGPRGVIKPDAEGYYLINGGSIGRKNRWGVIYDVNQYVLDCTEPDSDLYRRIKAKSTYMEMNHPTLYYLEKINGQVVRTKITTMLEWIQRLKYMDMDRCCGFIRDILFDKSNFNERTNEGYIDFKVDLTPFGVFGPLLKTNLDSPDMNTAISIRTVTAPQKFGVNRQIEHWSNVDWVPEPGFEDAYKHSTPGLVAVAGLESFGSGVVLEESELSCRAEDLISLLETELKRPDFKSTVAGMESFNGLTAMLSDIKRANVGSLGRTKVQAFSTRNPLDLF